MDKVIELVDAEMAEYSDGAYADHGSARDQLERFYTLARADLEAEIADLHTTMMAAAVEIQEQWEHHCDAEGYGPANLMHRLERGIASKYGYDAKTMVRMDKRIEELEAELLEQASVNGMGSEREAKLLAELAATRDLAEGYAQERNELKAENAKLQKANKMLDTALCRAYPYGCYNGDVAYLWNAARASLGDK